MYWKEGNRFLQRYYSLVFNVVYFKVNINMKDTVEVGVLELSSHMYSEDRRHT